MRYLILLFLLAGPLVAAEDRFLAEREALVGEIEADVRATRSYLDTETLDAAVLEAMRSVPRHRFVPDDEVEHAYENRPLPIGHGQTISQPYIVAIMTDLLEPAPEHKVLEVGTGSGYQAAVLAEIVESVHSIEIIEPLGESARRRLEKLGHDNVQVRVGDGYYGWPEGAPYDGIVVTAVASHVPPPLLQQLKPGGRMIIPVGSRFLTQQLVLVEKAADGTVTTQQILPVRFVPLTGGHD
ncbi:MAG: protein-L-isoaspartate(D-aspartate) O-methyltransferase [Gammaproteobacteria bacterium]|nr:protein-L-isoaspartate(D-aspartate) O-methyltransferase [Gammaproteobacteria bacterium]